MTINVFIPLSGSISFPPPRPYPKKAKTRKRWIRKIIPALRAGDLVGYLDAGTKGTTNIAQGPDFNSTFSGRTYEA